MPQPDNSFNRMRRGELPVPPVLTLLGGQIRELDEAASWLEVDYLAAPTFANPAGTVQGGMLCAMLDDVTAALVDAGVAPGQAVATLNLNVAFLRPARLGPVQGQARMVRRGRDICCVQASLWQAGQEVATAMATCKVLARPDGRGLGG